MAQFGLRSKLATRSGAWLWREAARRARIRCRRARLSLRLGRGRQLHRDRGLYDGTASSDVTWITAVTSVSTVNYTVQPNTGTSSRIGHITVNGQTFTVTQAGASVTCSYSLSSSSASVAAGGGSGSFTVTADTGCVVGTASSDVIWITPATSGSTVNYTVQPNTTSNSRTGHITVNGQTFTVTQAGAGPAVPPAINTGGIVNAADYTVSLAPGSMTALYGQNLAPATLGASSVPLPNTLSNVWVDITDANGQSSQAPLYFVSANQINFQMPFGVASPVDVRVRNAAGSSDTQSVPLWPRAPKLITKTQDGKGDPICCIPRTTAWYRRSRQRCRTSTWFCCSRDWVRSIPKLRRAVRAETTPAWVRSIS